MQKIRWQVFLSAGLLALSAGLYFLHFEIFRDPYHIFFYILSDIAFLPIEVLLVVLILERFLHYQEKQQLMSKLNMVIGAFFSEVGTQLLAAFFTFDGAHGVLGKKLLLAKDWGATEYRLAAQAIKQHEYAIDARQGDLAALRDFLKGRREFLLRLLENPNLLEHEKFTELLWAVFHLTEELCARVSLRDLTRADYEHLAGDIKRAYTLLTLEWLFYMRHLQKDYPYLFSLARRTNPFDPHASAEIR